MCQGGLGPVCPAWFSSQFMSLLSPRAAGASPALGTSSMSSLWRCGELEKHLLQEHFLEEHFLEECFLEERFLLLLDVCQM